MKVRVLVVDDHPHAREAIGEILAEDDGFEVIGYAENGERAVELTELWMPDLILMDIQMPGKDGLETTREIKLRYPYVKIVLITVSDDAAHLFEALKQGAQGYLLKNLEPGTWLEYLRAIASDEAPLSSELALRILQEFPLTKKDAAGEPPLTAREREILGWVAKGMTNREIAGELQISDQTVKNHLKNILHKLHLENRVQLTRYALERGWIDTRKK
ncbi:MAG: response regulator transcription factor [Paenibacillus macerans]|uniref:Bacterial regulatory s, luxR family protein n=1 Tax=Paenibacillus macerans TaxID=44252 RepID=A0A090ZCQ0_PAEMA|nr:response regulator transcription factor [Paenibacillus macerans]KFN09054.1 bacterial regulatory s, luxR family protein [Paenibacillus macerans]MBS5913284.1 response regulator transcription factor [Paenibacillus macerans]MCY7560825.1 response regulator transcription factor [Paenibacillus macerans]MDU7476289.1 response regulator transcription factor [Paenibacillus macerans]MEC0139935.1 response regulator transcription factor [Paenibacillus macerans]